MKKELIISVFLSLLTESLFAQFLVDYSGNVGVKLEDDPIYSNFAVNSPGSSKICSYIMSENDTLDIGLRVSKRGASNTIHDYTEGIHSNVRADLNSTKKAFGVYTHVYKGTETDTNCGRSYGIYAVAGNGTSGWNYGVFGTLCANNNGAGVYGSSESWNAGMDTGDRYAGFFHGKVKATNAIYAPVLNTLSDYRLKENVEPIGAGCVEDVMKLNVVRYNLKQRFVDTDDTTSVPINYYAGDSELLKKTHYGLIAQELQEIYPDLVYEDADGYLSVNYMEIIPILIKTVQDLKLKVDNLTVSVSKSSSRSDGTTGTIDIMNSVALYQNTPNPFTENTEIRCLVPEVIKSAILYIYDMNGRQINSRAITRRGNVSLTIEGSSLDAGIYLYSLIADGVVIDTKRMILTK
ncbi:MAG: tail fiber domain-containing protein [Bacteroidaceae bacterium]|nr:tail fiber domain-containing protein [Bacteroidaceae bacterium]